MLAPSALLLLVATAPPASAVPDATTPWSLTLSAGLIYPRLKSYPEVERTLVEQFAVPPEERLGQYVQRFPAFQHRVELSYAVGEETRLSASLAALVFEDSFPGALTDTLFERFSVAATDERLTWHVAARAGVGVEQDILRFAGPGVAVGLRGGVWGQLTAPSVRDRAYGGWVQPSVALTWPLAVGGVSLQPALAYDVEIDDAGAVRHGPLVSMGVVFGRR